MLVQRGQQLSLWSTVKGLHAEVQMGKEVATEVSQSGLRRSLGRIFIPTAYFSWGLIGWEGSFQDHRPTVSTKRRERPRGGPQGLQPLAILLP